MKIIKTLYYFGFKKKLVKKLVLVLIVVYCGYLLKSYFSPRSILTIYSTSCERYDNNKCILGYIFSSKKITFKINENAQTVLYKSKDESFKELEKCQIWNINNWNCQIIRDEKLSQVNGYLSVKDGVFTSTPPQKDKYCYLDLSSKTVEGINKCYLTEPRVGSWYFPTYGESGIFGKLKWIIGELNWKRLFYCHNKGLLRDIKCWFSF